MWEIPREWRWQVVGCSRFSVFEPGQNQRSKHMETQGLRFSGMFWGVPLASAASKEQNSSSSRSAEAAACWAGSVESRDLLCREGRGVLWLHLRSVPFFLHWALPNVVDPMDWNSLGFGSISWSSKTLGKQQFIECSGSRTPKYTKLNL